ncbi:hypothetical protein OPKNFCMD_5508 [Methylobacterium crusticola]|uniref:DUF4126 domain-containing protein n=1 Tax=Methylobacterium crusticola TaxID=1697972 RepID=A0ABQ4R4X5_9HYPH|nr:hypothetical protein [Methylobacterium crusticola]GJD52741.1 hypothetical protein OPKNFCMD_5508 [Methylobacterium crusticola]
MQGYGTSFGIGFVTGLRSMTACAALTWAASQDRTRGALIPAGPGARALTAAAALAEMIGDKMPFAPDRRIPPSFAVRLAIGGVGGWALAGHRASPEYGALAGVAGALAGTLLGRAARGGDARSAAGRFRGLAEDVVAAGLAMAVVASAEQRPSARVQDAPPARDRSMR